jgi:hypothetical protein
MNIQAVVGTDQDIIGFDPRGIGATVPRTDCFSYPYEEAVYSGGTELEDQVRGNYHRMMWSLQSREIGSLSSSTDALQKMDARARALSKLCGNKDSLGGNDSIMKYAHTPSVARDMISIIDAWDEWVDSLTEEANSQPCAKNHEGEESFHRMIEDSSHALDTKGKLVYWGFSYGVR